MFMSKVLISCAFLVVAQAGYAPAPKYGHGPVLGGYAAHVQPAVSVSVLPHAPAYGGAGYGAGPAYGGGAYGPAHKSYAVNSNAALARNPARALDREALGLANLAFAVPSAGGPIPTRLHVPQYHNTHYSAPAVVLGPVAKYGATGSNAAAAASNIGSVYPVARAPAYGAAPRYGPAAAY